MRHSRKTLLIGLCIASLWGSLVQAATLSSEVDRTRLHKAETVELTVSYDGDADGQEPDTQTLEQQFNIVSRNQTSSIQVINGKVQRHTAWIYTLLPRKTGQLLVPSFSIGNDFSEAIAITVDDAPRTATQQRHKIYAETLLDRPRVRVQEQAIITWRLVSRLNISDPTFMPPRIDNVLVQDLGARSYRRAADDGSVETVVEQRFALFAQQPGQLEIPPQQFQVGVQMTQRFSLGMTTQVKKPVTINTTAQTLDVLPAEDSGTRQWLPASRLEISQQFEGLDTQGRATQGQPFTRRVLVRAEGLSAEQLPPVTLDSPQWRVYPEQPVLKNDANDAGIIGVREDRFVIIPTGTDPMALPEIAIDWYDTANQRWQTATLPATTVAVLPDPQTAATAPPAASTPAANTQPSTQANPPAPPLVDGETPASTATNRGFWPALAAALLLGWLATLGYTWQLRRRLARQPAAPSPDAAPAATSAAPAALATAIQQQDLPAVYRLLQAHRRSHGALPESAQATLTRLEQHLFGQGSAPAADALQALPAQLASASAAPAAPAETAQLEPLYK